MLYSPLDLQNHYAAYQLVQEWIEKKQKEKERFANQEIAERYVRKWSFLERICAQVMHNESTARYHAAKEYIEENK